MSVWSDTVRRHAARKRADARNSFTSGVVIVSLGFFTLLGLIMVIAQGETGFTAIFLAVAVLLQAVAAFLSFNTAKFHKRMADEWDAKADEMDREGLL